VADARFAKPLDTALMWTAHAGHRALITVEQGSMLGFGGSGAASPGRAGMLDGRCAVRTMHLPDRFIDQASPADMYADAGLTSGDIAGAARGDGDRNPAWMERSAKVPLDPARLCPRRKRRLIAGAVFDRTYQIRQSGSEDHDRAWSRM
jgi:hypothetical protein